MPGIYIHIPFCKMKCLYCDFVSFPPKGEGDFLLYAQALVSEMEERAGETAGMVFDSLFFGGGTPSLLPNDVFVRIMEGARRNFSLSGDAEVTVEANPESISLDKAVCWKENGVNRLSVGVQSFADAQLAAIGRAHDGKRAEEALKIAAKAGFGNLSVDLICGLPGQQTEGLLHNIDKAAQFGAKHISCYQLQVEENTPLCGMVGRGELTVPDDDGFCDMLEAACLRLAAHGFERYEVSNFAKTGYASRHNMNYWQRGEYIGLGLAAHSFLGGARMQNTTDMRDYLEGKALASKQLLTRQDMRTETVMLSLRTARGLAVSHMDEGQTARAAVLENKGLLTLGQGFYSATQRGFEVLNSVILFLLEG